MRIPRFWAVVGSDADRQGRPLIRRAWGWSMSSAAEALNVARERLAVALTLNARSGQSGYYPRVPLREPILGEHLVDGEQAYAVTRNRYGVEVLNTDRLLISDIDLRDLDEDRFSFFGRRKPPPDTLIDPPSVVKRQEKVAQWAAAHPDLGVIVYRTFSGLRVFVTGFDDPISEAGMQVLKELGTDRIYRELCRTHGTFRARLTPKPWRLPRMRAPQGIWPFVTEGHERRFNRWLASYEEAVRGYAVCRRLATHGPDPSPFAAEIIRLHDERTRVGVALPLA